MGIAFVTGTRTCHSDPRGSMLALSSHNAEANADGPHSYLLDTDPAARRRERMHGGIRAWTVDVAATGGCRRGVALLVLTFDTDPTAGRYQGAIRRFWDLYRKRFGRLRYFSWLELQKSGRYHYHAMIVDAPPPWKDHDTQAIRQIWAEGLAWIKWRGKGWFNARACKYAASYAKKVGAKDYQQAYSEVPRTLRTFQCSRVTSGPGRVARLPKWARKALHRASLSPVDARRATSGGGWRTTVHSLARPEGPPIEVCVRCHAYTDNRLRAFFPPGKRPITILGVELEGPNVPWT
jgi:hypothetical protein